jgi:NAD(P)-dependent dehydrogenase (short-subunit alcohol dehydrogenase family)
MAALPEAVAVITGANKGIGYHIAEQIIASGKFGRVIVVSDRVAPRVGPNNLACAS